MDTARSLSTAHPKMLFVAHFAEMCIAMCVGMPLTFGVLALLGGSSFRTSLPELSLVIIAIVLVLPMSIWMLVRGMPLRPTLEMDAAAFGVVAALMAAGAAGVGPGVAATVGQVCGLSCGAMLAVMAGRFELYAGLRHHAGSVR